MNQNVHEGSPTVPLKRWHPVWVQVGVWLLHFLSSSWSCAWESSRRQHQALGPASVWQTRETRLTSGFRLTQLRLLQLFRE